MTKRDSELPATVAARDADVPSFHDGRGGSAPASAEDPVRLISRLKLEAAVLALMLITFAAIQFQELFTAKHLSYTPDNPAAYAAYSYTDAPSQGTSTITLDKTRAMRWSCELRSGYQYPFCGYGLLFDKTGRGEGLDFSRYQKISLSFRYSGPAAKMRIAFINSDPRHSSAGSKPNQMEFAVRQGQQTVTLDLGEIFVAEWWAAANKLSKELAEPKIDNVTAIEVQPGSDARVGHHEFEVESIKLQGRQISQAQYYLVLLGLWILLIGAFLIHRFFQVRRGFETRHQRQVQESRELAAAKAMAESASAAKSAFLANMSHELRTPLNAILGYAQLLERETLDARQTVAAQTIHQSGTHLLTLINDILDLSKIEAGRLELVPGRFDLHACLAGIANMMRIRAEEKGLGFVCAIDDGVPHIVTGDQKRLRQVLINLLGNAVKFTSRGQVSLAIGAEALDGGRVQLRIEIRDTGIGMAAEHLPRIFDAFEQVGGAEQRAGGTGLGLSITKQIVELMGGRIAVESRLGEGSRFWFEIELESVAALAAPSAVEPQALTGYVGSRRRILVIDDDGANRRLLVTTLAELGFDTDEAADGGEGIDVAAACRPDLVLTGLKMPVHDGYEVARRLRDAAPGLPVIVFSATADREAPASARAAGAAAFLHTPVSAADLQEAIAPLLDLHWTRGVIVDAVAAAEQAMVPPEATQLEVLLQLARAGNMRAIRKFADELGESDPRHRAFADRLRSLAAAYQSPAILDLVSHHLNTRQAA
ncbi:ATP-binding protein [Sphingosinicella sp. BN140058]|uniref:ATP-binding protein n=1 Tax=Sphingosinicella sp. BN140058 TaxID=1892855 RepID=UPI001010159E|nr:ATP-binding protein [Sphingosinicella sp. BN140058]QAY75911.1 response regulator [Sphingosinicella sp. BN140058]